MSISMDAKYPHPRKLLQVCTCTYVTGSSCLICPHTSVPYIEIDCICTASIVPVDALVYAIYNAQSGWKFMFHSHKWALMNISYMYVLCIFSNITFYHTAQGEAKCASSTNWPHILTINGKINALPVQCRHLYYINQLFNNIGYKCH